MQSSTFNHVPVSRAMEELRMSKFKFYGLVREGKITIKKLGRRSYVSINQVNELLENAPEAA